MKFRHILYETHYYCLAQHNRQWVVERVLVGQALYMNGALHSVRQKPRGNCNLRFEKPHLEIGFKIEPFLKPWSSCRSIQKVDLIIFNTVHRTSVRAGGTGGMLPVNFRQ